MEFHAPLTCKCAKQMCETFLDAWEGKGKKKYIIYSAISHVKISTI